MTNRRNLAIVLAFVLLGAVAIAGWVRTPRSASADTALMPLNSTAPTAVAPQAPALRAAVRSSYQAAPRTTVRRKRPFSHSAAIVGGSAGAGAAIGGLAGGGKGAAIGALSGGAAGFIYDHMTRNKQ